VKQITEKDNKRGYKRTENGRSRDRKKDTRTEENRTIEHRKLGEGRRDKNK
jgi:hypothetical protein